MEDRYKITYNGDSLVVYDIFSGIDYYMSYDEYKEIVEWL